MVASRCFKLEHCLAVEDFGLSIQGPAVKSKPGAVPSVYTVKLEPGPRNPDVRDTI